MHGWGHSEHRTLANERTTEEMFIAETGSVQHDRLCAKRGQLSTNAPCVETNEAVEMKRSIGYERRAPQRTEGLGQRGEELRRRSSRQDSRLLSGFGQSNIGCVVH